MNDVAQLITALAAFVTSMGGAAAAVIIALRSGARNARADPAQMSAMFDLIKKIPGNDLEALIHSDEQQPPPPGSPPPPPPPGS